MSEIGRTIVFAGLFLLLLGFALMFMGRLGLGHLPGDIVIRRGNFRLYLPLATSLLISIILSLLLTLLRK